MSVLFFPYKVIREWNFESGSYDMRFLRFTQSDCITQVPLFTCQYYTYTFRKIHFTNLEISKDKIKLLN